MAAFQHWIGVESRTLSAVLYWPDQRHLDLRFPSGRVYRYFDVPAQCYRELLAAESKGQYFNTCIRNCFPFQPLPPVAPDRLR